MPTREVAREFDTISAVYDETREPLDGATVAGLGAALRSAGGTHVLEVGVGTGRVARPLLEAGFDVTGVDASAGMMAKARAKGVQRLVRGSAYRLPFPDSSFDVALFVHVLHVLDDPARALREAQRVARNGAFALVHPPRAAGEDLPREEHLRHLIRNALAEQGYPVPPRASPWTKERDLLERLPPRSLQVLSEREVTESLRERVDRLEKRGQRYLLSVPPEVMHRAVESVRREVGDRTVTYHRVEAVANWTRPPLETNAGPVPT